MTLLELAEKQQDAVHEWTYTGCVIITPKAYSGLSPDYWRLDDYRVSGRCGMGLFLIPRNFETTPAGSLEAAVQYARKHENDLDRWRLIFKPGWLEPRWEPPVKNS